MQILPGNGLSPNRQTVKLTDCICVRIVELTFFVKSCILCAHIYSLNMYTVWEFENWMDGSGQEVVLTLHVQMIMVIL